MRQYDGEMLPVFLHCPQEEAPRRVGNPDRIERRKLTSAEELINYLDGRSFTAVPREDCIEFDTGAIPPGAVAREIVGRLGLTSFP